MILSTFTLYLVLGFVIYLGITRLCWPKNARQTSSQRLGKIRKASLVFSALLWVSFPLSLYWYLGFMFGWPGPGHDKLQMVVGHHVYSARSEMPEEIVWLLTVQLVLALFAAGMLLRLLWLYSKGIFFTAKNVNCIRFLGYYLIIAWFVNYQMQGTQREMDLSTNGIFYGLFVIFFAWIMDEGRKIQEEQELTV